MALEKLSIEKLNASGDLTEIRLGGAGNEKKLLTQEQINAPRETYTLQGNNPTMKMSVKAPGIAAQMQVVDDQTYHTVASMEWLKTTQEFIFTLMDRITGTAKAIFEVKSDGHAYIGGKKIANEDDFGNYTFKGNKLSSNANNYLETKATVAKLRFDQADGKIGQVIINDDSVTLSQGSGQASISLVLSKSEGQVHLTGVSNAKIDSGRPEVMVTKSWVQTQIPTPPTADGEYKLKVASGVMTWETI